MGEGKNNSKGFSMVELIIVIAILAILSAAIVPSVIKYIKKARASRATEELRTIITAVETGLVSSYAEEHTINANMVYTDDTGKQRACGVMTNWMISRAQNNSMDGISDVNALEYYFAQKVLEELDAKNGSVYPFFRFTGDEDEPLGMNCKSFFDKFGCPGIIVVYGDDGKVMFAQYYNYGCLIEYDAAYGYETLDDEVFVGAPKIQ